jgi:hypothetical protein
VVNGRTASVEPRTRRLFAMIISLRSPNPGEKRNFARLEPFRFMADIRQLQMWIGKNQVRKTLMVSVAVAALLAVTGVATAQGVNQGGAKASEPPTAAAPKADTAAPMHAPAAKGAEAATPGIGSKEAAPQHAQGKPDAKTTGEIKADGKSKTSDSAAPAATSKDTKNPAAEMKPASDSKTTTGEMKADGKTKASDSTTTSKDLKTPTAETKPSAFDSKTTGNAATSTAVAAPPTEKRTQITSAIKQEKVEEVTNVNFNVSIGTAVPAGVRYHPMPSRIVEIYPEWRGYDFILVHGKYIVLRPHTHEIVYIIEG